jgi:hypothetical protein
MTKHNEQVGFGFGVDSGRYSHNTARARETERIRKMVLDNGDEWHEGQAWDSRQLDVLLEAHLDGGYSKTGYGITVMLACGRSRDACGTALRKLAIRYPDFAKYDPIRRKNRSDTALGMGEYDILLLATEETGIKNGAADFRWLGKILGRDPRDVWDRVYDIAYHEQNLVPPEDADVYDMIPLARKWIENAIRQ